MNAALVAYSTVSAVLKSRNFGSNKSIIKFSVGVELAPIDGRKIYAFVSLNGALQLKHFSHHLFLSLTIFGPYFKMDID